MFKKFFKKNPDPNLENKIFTVIKGFRSSAIFAKIKFGIRLIFCLSILGFLAFYTYSYINNATYKSIESDQSVMVNVITDEIFIGSLNQKKPQALEDDKSKLEAEHKAREISTNQNNKELHLNFRANPLNEIDQKKAKIAIVVTGLGLNKDQTQEVINLNKNLTLGFSPYGADISGWIDQASAKGFEVLIQLPMQPIDYQFNDPGPYALLSNLSCMDNLSRLNNLVSRTNKNIGFYTQAYENFSTTKADVVSILNKLSINNYIFVYGNSQNKKPMQDLCDTASLECALANSEIEDEVNETTILQALNTIETEALNNGYSIIYINSYPSTLKILKKWIEELDSNKTIIVPISNLLPPFDWTKKTALLEHEKEISEAYKTQENEINTHSSEESEKEKTHNAE